MNLKQVLKILSIMFILLFLCLYFMTMGGYYEQNIKQKNILTEEAIARFEQDVSLGKEIIASNYIEVEKDYNTKTSEFILKTSNTISKTFNKIMKYIFKQIESTINS